MCFVRSMQGEGRRHASSRTSYGRLLNRKTLRLRSLRSCCILRKRPATVPALPRQPALGPAARGMASRVHCCSSCTAVCPVSFQPQDSALKPRDDAAAVHISEAGARAGQRRTGICLGRGRQSQQLPQRLHRRRRRHVIIRVQIAPCPGCSRALRRPGLRRWQGSQGGFQGRRCRAWSAHCAIPGGAPPLALRQGCLQHTVAVGISFQWWRRNVQSQLNLACKQWLPVMGAAASEVSQVCNAIIDLVTSGLNVAQQRMTTVGREGNPVRGMGHPHLLIGTERRTGGHSS